VNTGSLLQRLAGHFERAGISYMVVGSFASTLHGMPRTTHDIDIVVDLTSASLTAFLSDLTEEAYYISEGAARDALKRRTQFNVIDLATGWKIDLIVLKRRPFSVEEFQRRVPARLLDAEVFVASAEDTILSKLEWSAKSGSERQLQDVASIVAVKGKSLDLEYVDRWAHQLGVSDRWEQIRPQH